MKELPILFFTPMVEAILADRKKMTRRTQGLEQINKYPDKYICIDTPQDSYNYSHHFKNNNTGKIHLAIARYSIGDHLWVKETYYAYGYWEKTGELTKTGKVEYKFNDITLERGHKYLYETGSDLPNKVLNHNAVKDGITGWFKRPSLYMPKAASRILLECTGVRCERLHEISEEDAKAEGVLNFNNKPHMWVDYCPQNHYSKEELEDGYPFERLASNSFLTLWESINGIESVRLNPWVFIYEFKRI